MSLQDSINAYHLFLGRQPESERVASEKAELPIEKLASTFLGSREFSERILPPLSHNYPLPHFRVGGFPAPEMSQWARRAFPLLPGSAQAVESARTWRELLRAILTDKGFRQTLPSGISAALSVLDSKRSPASSEPHEIVGGVDDFSTFEIRGWAADLLNPNRALALEVFLDNVFIGVAHTEVFRREVQEKIGGEGRAGFLFNIPAAHLSVLDFERVLTIREAISRVPISMPMRVRGGRAGAFDALSHLRREVEIVSASLEKIKMALPGMTADSEYPLSMYDAYQKAARSALMTHRHQQIEDAAQLQVTPTFSVLLSASGSVAELAPSINSLRRQTYRNWECIVSIPAADENARTAVDSFCSADSRIKYAECSSLAGWQVANDAVARATGDYLLWLNEGDLLAEDALFELARLFQSADSPLVYFDEDRFDRLGGRPRYTLPALKTEFDRDHLLATNYIGNAFVCRKMLFEAVAGFRGEFENSWEYDFLLRAAEDLGSSGMTHFPRILYHRFSVLRAQREEEDVERVACVNAHLSRTGANAKAAVHADSLGAALPGCQRIVWSLPEPAPKLSIIIPTRDRADLLEPCIESVLQSQETYPEKFDIIIMDNESEQPETHALFERLNRDHAVRVIPFPGAFNWSAINNRGARDAHGDILIFLNNDTRVLSPEWARELASLAVRRDVGAVGARLLYEDGTIQHGGVILGGRAVHEAGGQLPSGGGYLGRASLQRNTSAVTGACLATRKDLFFELGGFDELNLKVAFNDVDYCLKVRSAGLSVIYTPFATLYHFESKSRGLDDDYSKRLRTQNEIRLMRARWGRTMEEDPFYNIRFNRTGPPFTRLRPQQMIADALSGDDEQELWDAE